MGPITERTRKALKAALSSMVEGDLGFLYCACIDSIEEPRIYTRIKKISLFYILWGDDEIK